MSESVIITLLTVLGGIIGAYITVKVRSSKPKSEYIDEAFKAYEVIMKRQDIEIQRLNDENALLREQLRKGV